MGLEGKYVVVLGFVLGMICGCNDVPPKCLAVDGRYMIQYMSLGSIPCELPALVAPVSGGESGSNVISEMRTDITVLTKVNMRGCQMDLDIEVRRKVDNTKYYDVDSIVDLRSDSTDNLRGLGHGRLYDSFEQPTCEGVFNMQLSMGSTPVPTTAPPSGPPTFSAAPPSTMPIAGNLETEP